VEYQRAPGRVDCEPSLFHFTEIHASRIYEPIDPKRQNDNAPYQELAKLLDVVQIDTMRNYRHFLMLTKERACEYSLRMYRWRYSRHLLGINHAMDGALTGDFAVFETTLEDLLGNRLNRLPRDRQKEQSNVILSCAFATTRNEQKRIPLTQARPMVCLTVVSKNKYQQYLHKLFDRSRAKVMFDQSGENGHKSFRTTNPLMLKRELCLSIMIRPLIRIPRSF
jgi:hypothetical protein